MASIGFVPVFGGALNALFGGAAPYVNGGVAALNALPWVGELAHLTRSAPKELKDLHKALEMLRDASKKMIFKPFLKPHV